MFYPNSRLLKFFTNFCRSFTIRSWGGHNNVIVCFANNIYSKKGRKMSNQIQTTTVKLRGGLGVIALLITLCFGPLGAFFSYWLIAKYSFARALMMFLVWLVLIVISVLSVSIFIGFILLPVVWVAMLVFVYKASNTQYMTFETQTTTKKE